MTFQTVASPQSTLGRRVGLSRAEYIRRALARERIDRAPEVGIEDLVAFANAFADLAEPEVMRQAWS